MLKGTILSELNSSKEQIKFAYFVMLCTKVRLLQALGNNQCNNSGNYDLTGNSHSDGELDKPQPGICWHEVLQFLIDIISSDRFPKGRKTKTVC